MIDVFTHILPPEYRRRLFVELERFEDPGLARFFTAALAQDQRLWDIPERLSDMEAIGPGYRQVLTLPAPALEDFAKPDVGAELARLATDELADLVAEHPGRFIGFAAQLPMNDTDAALGALDYAVQERGALGIQLGSNIQGRALDAPDFQPVLERVAELGRTIWLHPARGIRTPDYVDEEQSRYALFASFGWPYDTTLALARLVYSGLMERLPGLKVIAHHGGGLVPFYYDRVVSFNRLATMGSAEGTLRHPPLEYFKRFYVDTVGDVTSTLAGVLDFFGPEHVLFATDYGFLHEPAAQASVVDAINLSDHDRELVFEGNARRILGLDGS